MKQFAFFILFFFRFFLAQVDAQEKPRVLVLTDIENEPDDAQSLVRFLVYSNQFDVEGLIATTSTHLRDKTATWRIKEIVGSYGKVQENLLKHEDGFPTEEYLLSRIKTGLPVYGMNGVGEGQDSEGSEWLIDVVDKDDDRPVWIPVWGGANVLAQALWKVRQTRTVNDLAISKDFNIKTVESQSATNHYYWRKVIEVGEDYIVLSKTDCDTGSDEPNV